MANWDSLHNESAHEIPEDQYRGIMTSGLLPNNFSMEHSLRNCSLEAELDEAAQGTGLAFIVMADVFTQLPWSQAWSALFFLMLLALGLGSQIGILEGLMGTMFEMPQLSHLKKPILSGKNWNTSKGSFRGHPEHDTPEQYCVYVHGTTDRSLNDRVKVVVDLQ